MFRIDCDSKRCVRALTFVNTVVAVVKVYQHTESSNILKMTLSFNIK